MEESLIPDIEKVAEEAASRALKKRRPILYLSIGLLTFLTILVILLPVVFIEASAVRTENRNANMTTCRLVSELGDIEAKFIASNAKDRKGALTTIEKREFIIGLDKLFPTKLLEEISLKQQQLDDQTVKFWLGPLTNEVKNLQKLNCS